MSQESLDFGRLHRVSDGLRALYRHANDAVDQVGILAAAGACGTDRTDLRRALDRDNRFLRVDWAMAIAAIAAVDASRQIAQAFNTPLGFRVADEVSPMTDKEARTRLEVALRQLGPVGEQAFLVAMGGRR